MCSWVRKQISKVEDNAKIIADVSFPDEKTAAVVDGTVVSYTSRVSRKPELEVLDEVYTTTRLSKEADAALAPKLSGLTLADLPTYIEGEA